MWIPVDAAMPADDARVLAWVNWIDGPAVETVDYRDGKFWRDGATWQPCARVSHWQLLPEPPTT